MGKVIKKKEKKKTATIKKVVVQGKEQAYKDKVLTEKDIKIMVDPGHGDKPTGHKYLDSGCVSMDDKVYEKDLALKVAVAVKDHLTKFNIQTGITRDADIKDPGEKLKWRVDKAVEFDADVFVSVHVNTAKNDKAPEKTNTKTRGFLVMYHEGHDVSKKMAEAVAKEQKTIPLISSGISSDTIRGSLFVLSKFVGLKKYASILVEIGFITNPEDLSAMQLKSDAIGKEIAIGVYKFIFKKDPPAAEPNIIEEMLNNYKKNHGIFDWFKF